MCPYLEVDQSRLINCMNRINLERDGEKQQGWLTLNDGLTTTIDFDCDIHLC